MPLSTESDFDGPERLALDEIGRHLRAKGWAVRVTGLEVLQEWQRLASSACYYEWSIDNYTNDLTSRDAIELMLKEAPERISIKLRRLVELADEEFALGTVADERGEIAIYYRVDEASGWWWKRKPAAGPLAEYLASFIDSK